MKRYEYRAVPYTQDLGLMNKLGGEGWLLVDSYWCLLFAREIPDSLVTAEAGKGDAVSEGRTTDPFFVPGAARDTDQGRTGPAYQITDIDDGLKRIDSIARVAKARRIFQDFPAALERIQEVVQRIRVLVTERPDWDKLQAAVVDARQGEARAIAACLRSCAQTIMENRMEGPEAAAYVSQYADAVERAGQQPPPRPDEAVAESDRGPKRNPNG
jgi:hypothetical protein